MKILYALIVTMSVVLLYGCAATLQTPRVYRAQGVDFSIFITDTAVVYEPLLFKVNDRGLQGELTTQQQNIIRTMLQDVFRNRLREKLMPGMIERDHEQVLFKTYDQQNTLRRIFSKRRGKLTNNHPFDKSQIETVRKFREESRIRFVVVPAEVVLTRNLLQRVGKRATIQYNFSVYFQVWDLEKGDIILEKRDFKRDENTFYDFESELVFIENTFQHFANQLFASVSTRL